MLRFVSVVLFKNAFSNSPTFADSCRLISKLSTWTDRDKAIAQGLKKFNSRTAKQAASDPQARFGCKGNKQFCYGYKSHVSVDMQCGPVNRAAARPADVPDAEALKHICPKQGAVYADKGYCTQDARKTIRKKGYHDAAVKKNSMKGKKRDKDRWISRMRFPPRRGVFKME